MAAPMLVSVADHGGANLGAGFWLDELTTDMPDLDDALCAQTDPEAFFPEKGGSTRAAKAICHECAVAVACLTYALDHHEGYGIWGGLSERERRRILQGYVPWPAVLP